jgi:phosphohistidine phosphatase SixA
MQRSPQPFIIWCLVLLMLALGTAAQAQTAPDKQAWEALKRPGTIVLFRHANAPGIGDPSGFAIKACHTQRNLDAEGRAQALHIGERFRQQGVVVSAVLSSQWCRTLETAQLAFPGLVQEAPAFNSFFNDRATESAQAVAAREQLGAWRGTGVLVVVTHQVNIVALTGVSPASGEGVVLHRKGREFTVVAKIIP